MPNQTITTYMMISQMKELDLFDDIPYRHIKKIKTKLQEICVEIVHINNCRPCWATAQFSFDIEVNVSGGLLPIMVDKTFTKTIEYNTSSPYALMIMELFNEDEDEEEEE
tara:strand:- start:264 stop:593 length:330 start_codon:yes stop_codon:yes gene_type:complete